MKTLPRDLRSPFNFASPPPFISAKFYCNQKAKIQEQKPKHQKKRGTKNTRTDAKKDMSKKCNKILKKERKKKLTKMYYIISRPNSLLSLLFPLFFSLFYHSHPIIHSNTHVTPIIAVIRTDFSPKSARNPSQNQF